MSMTWSATRYGASGAKIESGEQLSKRFLENSLIELK
jgi:hypothetical protein